MSKVEVTNPLEALLESKEDNYIDVQPVTGYDEEEKLDEHGWSSEMRGAVLNASAAFNKLHRLGLHEHWLKNILIPKYQKEVYNAYMAFLNEKKKG